MKKSLMMAGAFIALSVTHLGFANSGLFFNVMGSNFLQH